MADLAQNDLNEAMPALEEAILVSLFLFNTICCFIFNWIFAKFKSIFSWSFDCVHSTSSLKILSHSILFGI